MAEWLPAQVFAFLFVFARVGAALMVVPAYGEASVPVRVRLALALAVSAALVPALERLVPPMPASPFALLPVIGLEVLLGLAAGGMARLLMNALHVAGTVVALQSGLAFAQAYDVSQGQQGVVIGNFLTLAGLALIFVSGTDRLLLEAIVASYGVFPPDGAVPVGDFARLATMIVAESFSLGLHIAAPFVLFGIVFNLGLGILNRLMPVMQVFFVALPVQLAASFLILAATVATMLLVFLERFRAGLAVLGG